ncbi:MAG: hypothetical protein NC313_05790 [Butyrivibrio sp.]|nr:hypothetical protein [Butyrivibrio sp.]
MNYNYKNMLEYLNCNKCSSMNICFLRRIPLYRYPEHVQNFVINIPRYVFTYQPQTRLWYTKHQEIQECIVQYYDANNCRLLGNEAHYLTIEAQRDSDRKRIKELLKKYLDVVAKATEDTKPEVSIMFDGIGLVLASDYLEAVGKIFSMLKTMGYLSECQDFQETALNLRRTGVLERGK